MTPDIEKLRAQFESWATQDPEGRFDCLADGFGSYVGIASDAAWSAWQAALDSQAALIAERDSMLWAALKLSDPPDFMEALNVIDGMQETIAEQAKQLEAARAPINMILHCPKCRTQHIDRPEELLHNPIGEPMTGGWNNPPHRSHLCHACGCIWRPADVATNGVAAIETCGESDNWVSKLDPAIADAPATPAGGEAGGVDREGERAALWKVADLGKHWIGVHVFDNGKRFALIPRKDVLDGFNALRQVDVLIAAVKKLDAARNGDNRDE